MSEAQNRQYGGQALIEGVMIRGSRHVCVACREPLPGQKSGVPPPDAPIFRQAEVIQTFAGQISQRFPFLKWPLIRGAMVLLESMELGSKGLRLSAAVALNARDSGARESDPDLTSEVSRDPTAGGIITPNSAAQAERPQSETPQPNVANRPSRTRSRLRLVATALLLVGLAMVLWGLFDPAFRGTESWNSYRLPSAVGSGVILLLVLLVNRVRSEEARDASRLDLNQMAVGATVALGLTLGIGIFFFLPSLLAGLFQKQLNHPWETNALEGGIRLALFVLYLLVISRMPNIRRLFQYHGAEHQVIHAYERGLELTPENASQFSTVHPRCGTAFLAIVLVVSAVLFLFLGWQVWWVRLLLRLALLPLVAGISYELLKWNARRPNPILHLVALPGLWFQKFTTKPPSRAQVEVAIAAMEGVLAVEAVDGPEAASAESIPMSPS